MMLARDRLYPTRTPGHADRPATSAVHARARRGARGLRSPSPSCLRPAAFRSSTTATRSACPVATTRTTVATSRAGGATTPGTRSTRPAARPRNRPRGATCSGCCACVPSGRAAASAHGEPAWRAGCGLSAGTPWWRSTTAQSATVRIAASPPADARSLWPPVVGQSLVLTIPARAGCVF
jgi:hypothetical protein